MPILKGPNKEGGVDRSINHSEGAPLPSHHFLPDGLLVVNPEGRHPIYDLVERAKVTWNAKQARASTTYKQLVSEYRRRYGRAPPPGFDKWWKYVREHNVQLPDEYDQIYVDLQPFWGIKPTDLKKIQTEWEGHDDTYTLGKEEGKPLRIIADKLPGDPAKRKNLLVGGHQMIHLLEDIQHHLSPFRAVFSPHDSAKVFINHAAKSLALKAAASGKALGMKELPRSRTRGWVTACPPGSPALTKELYTPKDAKSFIYDHRAAMDPCKHPSLLREHGQFISHGVGPFGAEKIAPLFSYSSSAIHSDIHITPTLSWVEDIHPRKIDPEFEDKTDDRLLWRGANTGIRHDHTREWRLSQRDRLVAWANDLNNTTTVLPAHLSALERIGVGNQVNKAEINPAMFDIAFSGRPLFCGEADCKELVEKYDWRASQSIADAGKYKYVFDVDGNGWSSRFKRLITSNSLIFKATVYPEWFTDRIEPWVHYIPVKYDYTDVHDSLTFFRGDLAGRGSHLDMASQIAKAGREWSKAFWRKEDMVAYMFRLFLEYARVMREDRDSITDIET
ncbi:glycosyltransferase family 90 protein [Scleroderma yunnanense]